MLLATAKRRIGLADPLARLIADPREPLLVTHGIADILRGAEPNRPADITMFFFALAISLGFQHVTYHYNSIPFFKW